MRVLRECSSEEVLGHWELIDRWKECPHASLWRKRIWEPLPAGTRWYEAEVEKRDLGKIFIISADEWSGLGRSLRLTDVAGEIGKHASSSVARSVLDLIEELSRGSNSLEAKLTIVSPSLNGDFTLIDGNKRAIALYSIDALVGSTVYLGVSTMITEYPWARRVIQS